MDKPLTYWYCDRCGEKIKDPEKGYVVWNDNGPEDKKWHGFKIIHQKVCDVGNEISSLPLPDFLGSDGLTRLLSWLTLGPHSTDLSYGCRVKDMDEFVDFFRRVQVPYYEEARLSFGREDVCDFFNDMTGSPLQYSPENMKRIAAGL